MTLTQKDLEESEVKLGSRSKALVPEGVNLKDEAEPEPVLKETDVVEAEPVIEAEPKPGETVVEPEPVVEPEDLDSVMREYGLDKRFSTPAEVMRAYRELERDYSRTSQDTASLRREFFKLAEELKKPKTEELDDSKINEMFVENPAQAMRVLLAKHPIAAKSEVEALKEQIQQSEARRVVSEIETFKRSHPEYKKYEPQMMEIYNRFSSLQREPLNEVLPFLLSAVKGQAPAKPETNLDKKNRAKTSSGDKRKVSEESEPNYDKMSLEELEERLSHPQ